jgi:hypothetical protein
MEMRFTKVSARGSLLWLLPAFLSIPSVAPAQDNITAARTLAIARPAGAGMSEKWSSGYLLQWRVEIGNSSDANLFAFDRQGKAVLQQRISYGDAATTHVFDAAVSTQGVIGAAGRALSSAGEVTGFVAMVPLAGGGVSVVRTSPLEPMAMVFGSDGALWVFGYELGPKRSLRRAQLHSALRRYGPDGSLLGEYLPWPETACGNRPAVNPPHELVSNADTVALWLGECGKWFEFSTAGDARRFLAVGAFLAPGGDTPSFVPSRVAMTDDGGVYVIKGPEALRLNRSLAAWEPFQAAPDSAESMLGADGASLVYRGRDANITWVSVKR